MQWCSEKSLNSLVKYVISLNDKIKTFLEENFIPKVNLNEKPEPFLLSANNNLILNQIRSKELQFFQTIEDAFDKYEKPFNKERKIHYINQHILGNKTCYKERTFVRKGSFGEIRCVGQGEFSVMKKLLNDKYKKDFEREKKLLIEIQQMSDAENQNLHIVRIDRERYSENSNVYYMEEAKYDLEDCLQDVSNDEMRISLITQLFDATKTLYNLDILHRDLNPRNILIFESDGKFVLKIADFGLAKKVKDIDYLQGHQRKYYGVKEYTAPQVIGNLDNANFSTELYSVSKIIREILKGFNGEEKYLLTPYLNKCETFNYSNIQALLFDLNKDFAVKNWLHL